MLLTELPSELLLDTIRYCDAVTAIKCSMTCKRMWDVVQSVEVQYAIMLDICGLSDAHKPSAAAAALCKPDRLALLHGYDRAWRTLACSGLLEFRHASTRVTRIDVKDGVLAVLADRDGEPTVVVHVLPSKFRGVSHKTWTWPCPVPAQRLLLYPSLDLLLLSTYELNSTIIHFHPLKLSTGEPHPLAKGSFSIQVQFPFLHTARYSVCGTSLSFYCDPLQTVQVVNWTTGVVVARLYGISQCMLLGENLVVACSMPFKDRPASIDIYRIDPTSTRAVPLLIANLFLPAFATEVLAFRPPGHFNPTGRRNVSKRSFYDECTFRPAPRMKTYLVFPLTIGSWLEHFELEIPLPALMKYAATAAPGPRSVSWDELLERGAVLRPAISTSTTAFGQNGRRFMYRPPTWQLLRAPRFQYMDYAPLRVARARRDGLLELRTRDDAAKALLVTEGDVFVQGGADGQPTSFIDSRPAPAAIFKKRDGVPDDDGNAPQGGVPVPRLVCVRTPRRDEPSSEPNGRSGWHIALDSFTEDGFVYVHADEDPTSAIFTTYFF